MSGNNGENLDDVAARWAGVEIPTLADLAMEIRQLAQMSALRHESLVQAIAGMPRKPRKVLSLIRPVGATTAEGRKVHELVAETLAKLSAKMAADPQFATIDPVLEIRMAARRWADRTP